MELSYQLPDLFEASSNLRLALDLVASRMGLGSALQLLAFLETDVHNNWRPFKPYIDFVESDAGLFTKSF